MPQLHLYEKEINEDNYPNLRINLRSARMDQSLREYIVKSTRSAIAVLVAIPPVFLFLFSYILGFPLLYSVPLSIAPGGVLAYAVYRLLLYYPKLKSVNRSDEIDDRLHHAVAYMLALSMGGYEPIKIFELLSEEKEDYGAIAKEAGAIYRDSKYFGYSPPQAIQEVAETTPSERFRDFLNAFASVVETGSNITEFLSRRVDKYYEEAEERQEEDMESLGVLSEFYVVALGLGPLLFVILLVLFGMMGQFYSSLLYLLIYLGLPLGTGLFALVLDMQTRSSMGGKVPRKGSEDYAEDLPWHSNGTWDRVKGMISKPSDLFFDSPEMVLVVSVPVALVIVLYAYLAGYFGLTSSVTFGGIISLAPLSFYYEMERGKREEMVEAAPDFLSSFAGALSSGLSPAKAIKSIPSHRLGGLASAMNKTKRDMEWGDSVSEAFDHMIKRNRSSILRRILKLVRRSSEVVSDLTDILEVLERDISLERRLKEERERTTFIYMLIVYITFGVFLLTAFSVSSSLLPLMTEFQGAQQPGVGGIGVGGVSVSTIKTIFFHACLIQGFSTGLLAGKLKNGEILSGLKHAIMMTLVAWAVFYFFVV